MEEVSLSSAAANLFAGDAANAATRQRETRNENPPEPTPPRVNEGPSTVTRFSQQALQLVQQERDAGNDADNGPRPPDQSGNAGSPPRNENRAEDLSRDDTGRSSPTTDAGSGNTSTAGSGGRLVNDPSPNELLRN